MPISILHHIVVAIEKTNQKNGQSANNDFQDASIKRLIFPQARKIIFLNITIVGS